MMENLVYKSTRGHGDPVSASYAIVHGIAEDGGLFVPDHLPKMDKTLEELLTMDYRALAYEVMKLYLPDFSEDELHYCIDRAYDDKFDTSKIVPLSHPGETHVLELFHGATLAFKDMALSVLPYLMTTAAHKQNLEEEIVILTATSGDTGKAALEGFANVSGVRIIVFYPKEGVSPIQKLQMVTQQGDNTHVVAIKGNFDDAQRSVKEIFTNPEEAVKMKNAGYMFSSANSINIGRLVPQIVYYYWGYLQMVRDQKVELGDSVNFCVPTGNFGNILAAHYAKSMGLPIGKLICASNSNNVLTDFFHTARYNSNRPFHITSSPSMDILVSSNLERLVYELCQGDGAKVQELMDSLRQRGSYILDLDPALLQEEFWADFADEEETAEAIRQMYTAYHYVMDPHTAVAYSVAEKDGKETGDARPMVIVSTASPYKFPASILAAIGVPAPKEEEALMEKLSEISDTTVPQRVRQVLGSQIRHHRVCEKDRVLAEVHDILGL